MKRAARQRSGQTFLRALLDKVLRIHPELCSSVFSRAGPLLVLELRRDRWWIREQADARHSLAKGR
jgi:hypothetical protein